jgi:hypothetical protein
MAEITVIDEKPQLVAGMRRKGHYREIAEMLASLFEYAMSCKAIIVGHPLFYITKRALRRQRERMRQAMPT